MQKSPEVPAFLLKAQIVDQMADRLVNCVKPNLSDIQAALIKSTMINLIAYAANFDLDTNENVLCLVEKEFEDTERELEQRAMDAIEQLRVEVGICIKDLPACRLLAPLESGFYFLFIDLIGMLCLAWLVERHNVASDSSVTLQLLRTQ